MGSETESPYSITWTQSNPVLYMRITSSLKPLLRAELLMGRMGEMRSPQNELAKQVNAFRFVKSLNYINFFHRTSWKGLQHAPLLIYLFIQNTSFAYKIFNMSALVS